MKAVSSSLVGCALLSMNSVAWLVSSSAAAASLGSGGRGFAGLSSASRSDNHRATTLFGVPRGGGLFGGKDAKEDENGSAVSSSSSSDGGEKKLYPAMSQKEVEEWLEPIPVYAVTDSNGAGVVLKPENDSSVFYFFLNPLQANATLQQLKSANAELDLKVSAFSLGKIWFTLLNNSDGGKEVVLKSPDSTKQDEEAETTKNVEYRLVPDTRDLLGARMLLTMSPEDGEKMKAAGGSMTPEMAQAAIQKAMTESPKFKQTYNEIPVFTIAQMRLQKSSSSSDDGDNDDSSGEPVSFLPMYFSLQAMVGTWQQFMSQAPADIQGVEPAINLLSLHELVEMMQTESEIDWRHVILVPTTPTAVANAAGGGSTGPLSSEKDVTEAMSKMGGATLGDV